MSPRSLSTLVLALAGCAGVQRVPLQSGTVRLEDGRFLGPVEIAVPRRADRDGHDFEIEVVLRARCAPLLTLAFPDGETEPLGDDDPRWQDLLARRAKAEPPAMPAPAAPATAALPSQAPTPPTGALITFGPPPRPVGHWERLETESWPGQLAFLRERDRRCARREEYRTRYLNAFDETGALVLWAEVPQEIVDGELSFQIVELVPTAKPKPPAPKEQAAPTVEQRPSRPPPPQPAPKQEEPAPAEAAGAQWSPGSWSWVEGKGEWVWHPGHWSPPATPARRAESPGAPPLEGCTWVAGHWTWEYQAGRWVWKPGHWRAPPPREDDRGEPPGPGAPWNSGHWTSVGASFEWVKGHWGRPPPLAETPPAPPHSGAQWIPGAWIEVRGRFVWSPGFYAGTERPPPPRAETPTPQPAAGAVWLQGYWRWSAERSEHLWIAGLWELPPGEAYVWVPDPPGPAGIVISGHWELRVRRRP